MTLDLHQHLDHFGKRVIEDALAEATSAYWRRRASALEAALPRPGDYLGASGPEALSGRVERIEARAAACRAHAALLRGEVA